MVLGPIESPADCYTLGGIGREIDPVPGHDLGMECPVPGEDWSEGIRFLPGAPESWTELSRLGFGPRDGVDLDSYIQALGLSTKRALVLCATYAANRSLSPIEVELCWTSLASVQVWINERKVTDMPYCLISSVSPCDCTQVLPATLVPGTNRILVVSWAPIETEWSFGLQLRRPDGRAIDDSTDPEVKFSVDPEDSCPGLEAFEATRSVEWIEACPSENEVTVTIQGNGRGDPGEALTVTETIHGAAVPFEFSHPPVLTTDGDPFTTQHAPRPCNAEPRRPVGVFSDHRDVGSTSVSGETVEESPGLFQVTGSGQDVFSCGESFHFAYFPLMSDFNITVHIAGRDWSGPAARLGKFGLMVREECLSQSRYAFIHDSSPNSSPPFPLGSGPDPDGVALDARTLKDAEDISIQGGKDVSELQHADFLRLERTGNSFIGFASVDGKEWKRIGEIDWGPTAPCEMLAGLAVLSNPLSPAITIRFDQLAVSGGAHPCPSAPVASRKITWNVPRSALNASITYKLQGSGSVKLAGSDGRHAIAGERLVRFGSKNPVGPDFEDARDVGKPIFGPGSTVFDEREATYTQVGSGLDVWDSGDSAQFAYRRMAGDFNITAQILERRDPSNEKSRWGKHGLIARKSCLSNSKYSAMFESLGVRYNDPPDPPLFDPPFYQTRVFHGIDRSSTVSHFGYPEDPRPDFLRLIRHGNTFYSFSSRDGTRWDPLGSDTWYGQDSRDPVLVGFMTLWHSSQIEPPVVKFRVLHLGPLEPPPLEPLEEDGSSSETVIYTNKFDDLSDFQVQQRGGTFDPRIDGGRLRMQDRVGFGSSTSAFRKVPIEDVDSAIYQFEFDVFISRDDAGETPAEGLTFVLTGGRDVTRVGLSGGHLGYEGLGGANGEPSLAKPNTSSNGFAVEFDTARGFPMTNEGDGSPTHSGAWHLGIDAQNNVNSVVQTSAGLPDIFNTRGVHARVRYNRGRVQVWVAQKGDPLPAKSVLEADLIPISYLASDESAVFGFTASTGTAAETGEVDDLTVTRIAPGAQAGWLRCDANGDRQHDVSDPISALNALFNGGAALACPAAGDCNGDASLDISDPVFDLTFQFLSGPAPPAPYPACELFPGCAQGCR